MSTSNPASPEFLEHLAALFPSSSSRANPYHYIAGIVLAANNHFDDAAAVYTHAVSASSSTKVDTSRIFREALFKTGVLYGAPRMINTLLAVSAVTPADVLEADKGVKFRDTDMDVATMTEKGYELFRETYGESSDQTIEMLQRVHPDFLYQCITLVYGPLYGFMRILPEAETSLAMIAALAAIDCPLQAGWHIKGAVRHGATMEEVKGIWAMAVAVMKSIGKEVSSIPQVLE